MLIVRGQGDVAFGVNVLFPIMASLEAGALLSKLLIRNYLILFHA